MALTIADLKVGERIFFGRYGATQESSEPISWLKATRGNTFISEFVIDWLPFDGAEPASNSWYHRTHGNSDYAMSNISQFLNSSEECWFEPQHSKDSLSPAYADKPGFLNEFEGFEMDSLSGEIRIPTASNIVGGSGFPMFELFNRKGKRAKSSEDLINRSLYGFVENGFVDFWLMNIGVESSVKIFTKGGMIRNQAARSRCGVRPVCGIKPETVIQKAENGNGYVVAPFESSRAKAADWTDEELMSYLGLL